MGRIHYLTGPVRSGKSRRAVELASGWGDNVVFVATYRADPQDAEMQERLRRHRSERPAWRCLEAPRALGEELGSFVPAPSGAVVDCLTLWAADRLDCSDEQILEMWSRELEAMRAAPWPTVIVGNEIGWAPVPESPLLRRYRDLIGTLAQRTAAAADEAWLLVAGCPVKLKSFL